MLVKKSIVEKWYQRDSWVYKNFSYLFENPLWDKRVPNGFSVCPYFWLSIFSLFIFRPLFVCPIRYLLLPIIHLIGKPAHALDTMLANLLNRIFGRRQFGQWTGEGIVVSLLLTLCASGILFILGCIGVGLYNFYPFLTKASNLGMFSFWSITSFLTLFGIISAHKKITNTECQTSNYLYVWVILFAISIGVFIPHEFATGVTILLNGLGKAFSSTGGFLWVVIAFVAKWVWFGLAWCPLDIVPIPWWGYLMVLTGAAYFSDRVLAYFERRENERLMRQTGETYWNQNREAWITVFTRTLTFAKYWSDGEIFNDDDDDFYYDSSGNEFERQARTLYRYTIYRKAMEIMMGENLVEYQKRYPMVPNDKMELIKKVGTFETRFCSLAEELQIHQYYDRNQFKNALVLACKDPDIKKHIDEEVARLKTIDNEKSARRIAHNNGWMHQMCLRVTGLLNRGARSTGRGIATGASQLWTFLVYLWMLLKAKKQGACPYFKFTDAITKIPQNPNDKFYKKTLDI